MEFGDRKYLQESRRRYAPIELRIMDRMRYFCRNFNLNHISRSSSSCNLLEGFVGRLLREFGVVIGAAVLISACILNAYANVECVFNEMCMNKKSKFYSTEPYFERL
jgi:hypothetical protein